MSGVTATEKKKINNFHYQSIVKSQAAGKVLGNFFLPVRKTLYSINPMEDIYVQQPTQTGYDILIETSFTCLCHVNWCVCPHVCLSASFPAARWNFWLVIVMTSPSVSLLTLRLHLERCRHPLWPLIFSATGTGCHIPRSPMSERGVEGGVAWRRRGESDRIGGNHVV